MLRRLGTVAAGPDADAPGLADSVPATFAGVPALGLAHHWARPDRLGRHRGRGGLGLVSHSHRVLPIEQDDRPSDHLRDEE